MRVFVGMETSGVIRRAFQAAGHDVYSCDLLPAQDGETSRHLVGDIFETLDRLHAEGWRPDLAIFHPDCTHLTISAAWAFKDPDYDRYPLVGYHQKVKAGTLVGRARREARDNSVEFVKRIWALPIKRKVIENPIGWLSSLWRKPTQVIQPNWFGEDASKATCLWIDGLLPLRPTLHVPPTLRPNGKAYWGNQTDSGQNKLPPKDDRWQDRADTYPGIAAAMTEQWGGAA